MDHFRSHMQMLNQNQRLLASFTCQGSAVLGPDVSLVTLHRVEMIQIENCAVFIVQEIANMDQVALLNMETTLIMKLVILPFQ